MKLQCCGDKIPSGGVPQSNGGGIAMNFKNVTIEGDKITLTKKEIKEWRDHYRKMADEKRKNKDNDVLYGFYLGKSDALTEIIKEFDKKDE